MCLVRLLLSIISWQVPPFPTLLGCTLPAQLFLVNHVSLLEIKSVGFRVFCDTILAMSHRKIAYASSKFGRCSKSLSVSKVLFKLIFYPSGAKYQPDSVNSQIVNLAFKLGLPIRLPYFIYGSLGHWLQNFKQMLKEITQLKYLHPQNILW